MKRILTIIVCCIGAIALVSSCGNSEKKAAQAAAEAAAKAAADSVAAAEAVIAAQEEVEKLQAAIDAMKVAGSNAKDLENLAADLDAAK
ncbi:MAG: hypothetical protein IIV12_03200, partial [Bacteroidales bacterium]|nr:hypothetical protein [Bacteroidales bacterium]